jgi:ATP-dependent DNA helicase RecG
VKRVGERIAEGLAKRGVETVEDLLYHLPFRYEDRLNPRSIAEMKAGEMASLIGDVRGSALLRTKAGACLFELTLGLSAPGILLAPDLSGAQPRMGQSTIQCTWFNGNYLKDRFRLGQRIAVYGKLEPSRSGGAGRYKLIQPQFEMLPEPGATGADAEFAMLEMGRIVPVYESLGGKTPWGAKLTSRWMRRVMWTVFRELAESGAEADETLPAALRERLKLPGRR